MDCGSQDKQTQTYKSTSSSSLWPVALVIPRSNVVPWGVTWLTVALLRVLRPLPCVLFPSEGGSVGGRRGRGGRGRSGTIPLLLSLPVRKTWATLKQTVSQVQMFEAVVAMVTETSLVLGFLVVFPTFLRGPLSAGPPGASWAPAALTFVVSLFACKLLTSFNIQPQVHHVTFELFTWIL